MPIKPLFFVQTDLSSVREQFESDFLIWRREHEAAFKIREVEKENTVRNQCRIDRDKQIDDIVAKVDSEALKTQKDFESKILLVVWHLFQFDHFLCVCLQTLKRQI